MSILTIFLLTFYLSIVSCDVNTTTQFDNFTIEWQNFDILTCAVPTTVSISLFNCLPPVQYTQVDDISCLQQTTIDFDQNICQATSTGPISATTIGITTLTSSSTTTISTTTQTSFTTTTSSTTQTSSITTNSATQTSSITTNSATQTSSITTNSATQTSSTTAGRTTQTSQSSSVTSNNNTTSVTTSSTTGAIPSNTNQNTTVSTTQSLLSTANSPTWLSLLLNNITQLTTSSTTQTIIHGTIQTTSITHTNDTSHAMLTMATMAGSTNRTTATTTGVHSGASNTTTAPSHTVNTGNPYQCAGNFIGSYCNVSSDACTMSQPCLNLATCFQNYTLPLGYACQCQSGYAGANCQQDNRICKESTCWNNGTCIEMNSTVALNDGSNFVCDCNEGFNGIHCELHVDLCGNITCQNNGICKTTNMIWKCICIDSTLYSGDYCQLQSSALKIHKALSKSFASVAITAITATCSFILLMDALKYIFHIDPVKDERINLQKEKVEAKRAVQSNEPKVAIRFQYIA